MKKGKGVFCVHTKGVFAFTYFRSEKETKNMSTVSDYFGSKVFDDRVMRANLSADVYASLRKTIDEGKELDLSLIHIYRSLCVSEIDSESYPCIIR